jgi:hypothetical protein
MFFERKISDFDYTVEEMSSLLQQIDDQSDLDIPISSCDSGP